MSNMFSRIPKDPFSMIGYLSLSGIHERKKEAIYNIKLFKNKKQLYKTYEFIEYSWFDCCKGDFDSLKGIGYLPINQSIIEYYDCLEMLIQAQYKAAYSSLRRMFEMAIMQIFFSTEGTDKEKAKKWYLAEEGTPNFSAMIIWLAKQDRFKDFEREFEFSTITKKKYHEICDIVHIKGLEKTYLRFQQSTSIYNGYHQKRFDKELFEKALNDIIDVVSIISVYYVLANPIIWFGLPMWRKFGDNPPMSGFLSEGQSQIVHDIVNDKYKLWFDKLSETDKEVISLKEWVLTRPDLTDEEIMEDIRKFDEMIESNNTK